MQSRRNLFTSESVSIGHPDKAADQVADAVLDAALAQDPDARVACEVLLTRNLGIIAGEVTTFGSIDYEKVLRDTVRSIGYTSEEIGFSADEAEVRVSIGTQSPDIARGVDRADGEIGAGDQGLMFGYACSQTAELMPLPIVLANRLVAQQHQARISGSIPHLRPDAKSQVTVRFDGRNPVEVASVVLSTQHGPEWSNRAEALREAVIETIIRPALGEWWRPGLDPQVNPTGQFEQGGPGSDTGLTGRKIIVDTYGGWSRHGGGAFSGKDPTKVDRSAGYMARHVAKTVVASGLARECEVSLSYVIGIAEPSHVAVDCFGTAEVDEAVLERVVTEVFSLTPSGIISSLDLRRPIYRPTSYHGHFGREPGPSGTFPWEKTDRAEELSGAF